MRRTIFKSLIPALAVTLAVILAQADRLQAAERKVHLGLAIHSTNNEVSNQQVAGVRLFVSSQPAGSIVTQILTSGGDDKKQMAGIRSFISEHGQNAILYVEPSSAANTLAISTLCEDRGVYWTSAWNRAKGLFPWNLRYYVMHQSVDGVKQGYDIAVRMFKEFKSPGRRGRILALQGPLNSNLAVERFQGLQKALAEYEVDLLEAAACNWDPESALKATEAWLGKFQDIDGIWSANDDMALAAVKALKARDLNRKIKVAGVGGTTGALGAIETGDLVCTSSNNGYLQGGYGAAYVYKAWNGEMNPMDGLSRRQRAFYTDGILVDRDSLAGYLREFIQSPPDYNFNDLKFPVGRPMNLN